MHQFFIIKLFLVIMDTMLKCHSFRAGFKLRRKQQLSNLLTLQSRLLGEPQTWQGSCLKISFVTLNSIRSSNYESIEIEFCNNFLAECCFKHVTTVEESIIQAKNLSQHLLQDSQSFCCAEQHLQLCIRERDVFFLSYISSQIANSS